MGLDNKYLPWGVLIVLFVGFQAIFILADSRQTAPKTAKQFIKAYYALDESMADMICNELKEGDLSDPVSRFIGHVTDEAQTLGHNLNYMRSQLLSLHVKTLEQSEDSAVIHVSGKRKRCIHPLFTLVGRLFFLGDTYPVEKNLKLVREDDGWRVCNDLFNINHAQNIYGRSS